jgi:hypothetical protein
MFMKFAIIAILAVVPLSQAQDVAESGPVVKGTPYSALALTEITQTLPDGSHAERKSSSTLYRDSAGRERRETPQSVSIYDPVAGVNYTLDTTTHVAHRMTPAPTQAPAPAGGGVRIEGGITITGSVITPQTVSPIALGTVANGLSVTRPKIEQLGTMTVEGVQAEGIRTTITIPAGQMANDQALDVVSERWYAPDLKVAVLTKHSDPRIGETVYRLTQITRGEPVHSLFEVPADYTVTDDAGPIKTPNGAIRLP